MRDQHILAVALAMVTSVEPGAVARSYTADMKSAATELWRFRDLLYQLTLRDIRIRYKQAVFGFAWALFMPVMIVLAGCLVRFVISGAGAGGGGPLARATVAALSIKALAWAFFIGTISFSTSSLTGNLQLVTKVYFPRAVLPLSATLTQCFDTAIASCALVVLLPFLGAQATPALAWVPVLAVLLFLLTVAASLFVSCANLFYRDVKYIVQVLIMFGIFFTPVFFEPSVLSPRLANIVMLNPVAPVLEGLRLAIVEGHNLLSPLAGPAGAVAWSPGWLLYSALWSAGGLVASATLFHRAEFVFAEYA
jgi:ABC-type polysaccharide/polyol phosphate export permease